MRYLLNLSLLAATLAATSCARQRTCCPCDVVDQTYVHKYGVEVPPGDWTARGQNGKVITTQKNGVVVTKNYVEGALDGETTYTFPHSEQIEKVETYSKNTIVKDATSYVSGAPLCATEYQPGGKVVNTWYENGSPKSTETYQGSQLSQCVYYNNKNQVDTQVVDGNGKRNQRDSYGVIIATDTIENGVLVSTTTYHPNGHPKEVIPFVNGVIEGEKKTFLPAGEPNTVEQWKGGKQNGTTTVFHNGEKVAEVTYVNGHKYGVERRFRDGVTVVEEVTWVNDQKHGPNTFFIGNAVKTDWFYQDRPVSKPNFDQLTKPLSR